jgi:membrane protein implicated in regulation of membrane protease activity
MGIGVGIFLIVVGAILAFAVDATVAGLDINVVGWVLMLAGAAGLVLFFYFSHRRRVPREVMTERRGYDDADQFGSRGRARRAVVTERRSYDDTGQPPL